VCWSDLRDHDLVRLRHAGKVRDLARRRRAQLHDQHFSLPCRAEESERHAEPIVEALRRRAHLKRPGEHRGEELLRAGLAHAACNRHDLRSQPPTVPDRELLERVERLGHGDVGPAVGRERIQARLPDDARHRAAALRLRYESVAIAMAARQGDEHRLPRQSARVRPDLRDAEPRDGRRRNPLPPGMLQYALKLQRLHAAAGYPPRSRWPSATRSGLAIIARAFPRGTRGPLRGHRTGLCIPGFLIVLVAFPRDQHGVVRARHPDAESNGLPRSTSNTASSGRRRPALISSMISSGSSDRGCPT
jgi:hypothetical protein